MSATLQHIMLLSASTKINMEAVLDRLIDWGIDAGKNIIGAILIFIIGRFIIKQINRLVSKILRKRKLEVSVETFLKSLLSILLNLVLAFAIISKLGIETTSIAALLASAGVAVGMALSGNLSNFAGGLIILVFKPFKVGDYIDTETADVSNRKGNSDLPYGARHTRQQNHLRPQRSAQQQRHHQLQQAEHEARRMDHRHRIR